MDKVSSTLPKDAHKLKEKNKEPESSFEEVMTKVRAKEEDDLPAKEEETPVQIAVAPQIQEVTPEAQVNETQEAMLMPAGLVEVANELEKYCVTLVHDKGITQLETTYFKPGSLFDGLEISLNHFDTAPDAFHVEMYGTPDAARVLTNHTENLVHHLTTKMPNVKFHITPPYVRDFKPRVYLQKTKNKVSVIKQAK